MCHGLWFTAPRQGHDLEGVKGLVRSDAASACSWTADCGSPDSLSHASLACLSGQVKFAGLIVEDDIEDSS